MRMDDTMIMAEVMRKITGDDMMTMVEVMKNMKKNMMTMVEVTGDDMDIIKKLP
jgi:hypothetical protein